MSPGQLIWGGGGVPFDQIPNQQVLSGCFFSGDFLRPGFCTKKNQQKEAPTFGRILLELFFKHRRFANPRM